MYKHLCTDRRQSNIEEKLEYHLTNRFNNKERTKYVCFEIFKYFTMPNMRFDFLNIHQTK